MTLHSALAEAVVLIRADGSHLGTDVATHADKAGATAGDRMGRSLSKSFRRLVGSALVLEGAKSALEFADAFEKSRSRLEQITGNIGGNFDHLQGQVTALDDKMAGLGFTNADVEGSIASLETATKDPIKAMKDMALAADIARGRNIGLEESTRILQRVETGHVAMLSKLGIQTKDVNGHLLTQKQALEALARTYGGSATHYAGTFAGQQEVVSAEIKNSAAQIGVALLPAAVDLAKVLSDDLLPPVVSLANFLDRNRKVIEPLAKAVLIGVGAWKAYTLATRLAAEANLFFGGTAATAAAGVATEGAAAAAGGVGAAAAGGAAAGAAGRGRLARALPILALGSITEHVPTVTASQHADWAKMFGVSTAAEKTNTAATNVNSAAVQHNAASVYNASKAIRGLTADMETHASKVLAATGTYDSFRQLLNGLPGVVKQNGHALRGYSDAAIANRQALGDAANAIFAHVDAMKAQHKSAAAVRGSLLEMEKRLRAQATAAFGSRDAVDAFMRKLGLMPGQVKRSLAGLRVDGETGGHDLGAGLVAGIQAETGAVTTAAKIQADQVAKSMRLALQIQSPSKVTHKIGQQTTQGLIDGLKSRQAALQQTAKGLADSVSSSITGNAALTNTPNQTVGGVEAFLHHQLSIDRAFRRNLKTLASKGYDRRLIGELAQEGPEAAGNLARQLAGASHAQVRRIDQLERGIYGTAAATGKQTRQEVYSPQFDKLDKRLAELTRTVHTLASEVKGAQHRAGARS